MDSLYEGPAGHPFHEWIVTISDSADGWWGEGYIVHCGISLDEHRYISCLVLCEQQTGEDLEGELEKVRFKMPIVVLQYLQTQTQNEE